MTNGTFIPKPSVSMVQTVGASVTRVGPCILGPRMEDPLGEASEAPGSTLGPSGRVLSLWVLMGRSA